MAKSDLLAIKTNFYPSVNVVDSCTVDNGIKTLEAHSMVDTGGRIFTTDEKHNGLTTLVL